MAYNRRGKLLSRRPGGGVDDEGVMALDGVNLSVAAGQSIGIVGESGAGKTTLAAVAAGLLEPTGGEVNLKGARVRTNRDMKRRAHILQMIWQDTTGAIDPRMNVADAIAEPLRIHKNRVGDAGTGIGSKILELLQAVGLSRDLSGRYPHQLSGGQLQRVVIARALALNPEILICDEPAAALDARIKLQIAGLLEQLRSERGISLVVISHDLPLVSMIADELYVMRRGRIVESGATRQVMGKPEHRYTRGLVASVPVLQG